MVRLELGIVEIKFDLIKFHEDSFLRKIIELFMIIYTELQKEPYYQDSCSDKNNEQVFLLAQNFVSDRIEEELKK